MALTTHRRYCRLRKLRFKLTCMESVVKKGCHVVDSIKTYEHLENSL